VDFFGGREGLDVNRKRWESTLQAGAVQYSLRSVSVCSCAGRYQNIAAYLWKEFWGRCSGASRRQDSEPRGCQTSGCSCRRPHIGHGRRDRASGRHSGDLPSTSLATVSLTLLSESRTVYRYMCERDGTSEIWDICPAVVAQT
jgi:hypothetical protein